jgi:hypothetical protein
VKDYQRCAIANRGVEGGAAVGLRVGEGVSAMRLRYSTHPRLVGVWEDPWRGHRRRVQADVFVCVFFKDGECFNPLAPRHLFLQALCPVDACFTPISLFGYDF